MTSVQDFANDIKSIIDEIALIRDTITINSERMLKEEYDPINREISDLKEKEEIYNREFLNVKGIEGDSQKRKQTLQEYVLLFFIVSYIIFSISVLLWIYIKTQSVTSVLKISGIFFLLLIVISTFVLRYA